MSVPSEESKRCCCRIIPDRRCELIVCRGKELFLFYRIGLFLSKSSCFLSRIRGVIFIPGCSEGSNATVSRDARALRIPYKIPFWSVFVTLTKDQIISSIGNHLGISKLESSRVVESVLETVKTSLSNGEDVLISGFGKFTVRNKAARRGRNPQTGDDGK